MGRPVPFAPMTLSYVNLTFGKRKATTDDYTTTGPDHGWTEDHSSMLIDPDSFHRINLRIPDTIPLEDTPWNWPVLRSFKLSCVKAATPPSNESNKQ